MFSASFPWAVIFSWCVIVRNVIPKQKVWNSLYIYAEWHFQPSDNKAAPHWINQNSAQCVSPAFKGNSQEVPHILEIQTGENVVGICFQTFQRRIFHFPFTWKRCSSELNPEFKAEPWAANLLQWRHPKLTQKPDVVGNQRKRVRANIFSFDFLPWLK